MKIWWVEYHCDKRELAWLIDLSSGCTILKKIVLVGNGCALDCQLITQLDSHVLKELKEFSCESFGQGNGISEALITHLAIHSRNLIDLKLNIICTGTLPALVQLIGNNANTLTVIVILFKNFELGVEQLIEATCQCKSLTTLCVQNFVFDIDVMKSVLVLVRAMPQLNTLILQSSGPTIDLSRCVDGVVHLTCKCRTRYAAAVGLFLMSVPVVHHLVLRHSRSLNRQRLSLISQSLTQLQSISIYDCGDLISLQDVRDIFPQCSEVTVGKEKWTRENG